MKLIITHVESATTFHGIQADNSQKLARFDAFQFEHLQNITPEPLLSMPSK